MQIITADRNCNKNHGSDDCINTTNNGMVCERWSINVAEHLPVSARKSFFKAREWLNKYILVVDISLAIERENLIGEAYVQQ